MKLGCGLLLITRIISIIVEAIVAIKDRDIFVEDLYKRIKLTVGKYSGVK